MFQFILDFFFPRVCSMCGYPLFSAAAAVNTQPELTTKLAPAFCYACNPLKSLSARDILWHLLQTNVKATWCLHCGELLFEAGDTPIIERDLCYRCQGESSPVRYLRSLCLYEGGIAAAVKLLKYGSRPSLAAFFANIMHLSLTNSGDSLRLFPALSWDCIIPLPSSRNQLVKRGYFHTALIGRSLSKKVKVPLTLAALIAARARLPQAALNPEQRQNNVFGAFAANKRFVYDKAVLLIDDVMTTGASVGAAAQCLLEAGASSVDVLTIARSPLFRKQHRFV